MSEEKGKLKQIGNWIILNKWPIIRIGVVLIIITAIVLSILYALGKIPVKSKDDNGDDGDIGGNNPGSPGSPGDGDPDEEEEDEPSPYDSDESTDEFTNPSITSPFEDPYNITCTEAIENDLFVDKNPNIQWTDSECNLCAQAVLKGCVWTTTDCDRSTDPVLAPDDTIGCKYEYDGGHHTLCCSKLLNINDTEPPTQKPRPTYPPMGPGDITCNEARDRGLFIDSNWFMEGPEKKIIDGSTAYVYDSWGFYDYSNIVYCSNSLDYEGQHPHADCGLGNDTPPPNPIEPWIDEECNICAQEVVRGCRWTLGDCGNDSYPVLAPDGGEGCVYHYKEGGYHTLCCDNALDDPNSILCDEARDRGLFANDDWFMREPVRDSVWGVTVFKYDTWGFGGDGDNIVYCSNDYLYRGEQPSTVCDGPLNSIPPSPSLNPNIPWGPNECNRCAQAVLRGCRWVSGDCDSDSYPVLAPDGTDGCVYHYAESGGGYHTLCCENILDDPNVITCDKAREEGYFPSDDWFTREPLKRIDYGVTKYLYDSWGFGGDIDIIYDQNYDTPPPNPNVPWGHKECNICAQEVLRGCIWVPGDCKYDSEPVLAPDGGEGCVYHYKEGGYHTLCCDRVMNDPDFITCDMAREEGYFASDDWFLRKPVGRNTGSIYSYVYDSWGSAITIYCSNSPSYNGQQPAADCGPGFYSIPPPNPNLSDPWRHHKCNKCSQAVIKGCVWVSGDCSGNSEPVLAPDGTIECAYHYAESNGGHHTLCCDKSIGINN